MIDKNLWDELWNSATDYQPITEETKSNIQIRIKWKKTD
jgi:hypothetical protein